MTAAFHLFIGRLLANLDLWALIGFLGQGLFFGRFLVQWHASEKAKRSVVPVAFWYFSIGGALVTLLYTIVRAEPVFMVGQLVGICIYVRNLQFVRRERAAGLDAVMTQ